MIFISKNDIFIVSFQFIIYAPLVIVSTAAIDRFFSPVSPPEDVLTFLFSYFISVVFIAAFFTVFVRRDDIFRQKHQLSEELSNQSQNPDANQRMNIVKISSNSIHTGKIELMKTAPKVAVSAAILLLLIYTVLFVGEMSGYQVDNLREDIVSAFTNVIYLVALLGILFKDYKLE